MKPTQLKIVFSCLWLALGILGVDISFNFINAKSTATVFLGFAILVFTVITIPEFIYDLWKVKKGKP